MHNKVFVNAWHQLKTDLIKNGIQCIPLKGIYMLQDTYAKHTEIRMLADIDVLVSPADFLRSLQVLSSIGYTVSDKAMSAAKQSYICEVGVKIRVDNITVSIDLHRYPHNYPLFKEFPAQDIFNKPYKIDSWSTVDAVTWILTHKAKNGLIGDFKELFDYSVLTSNLSDDEWRQLLMRIKQLGLENPFHMFVLQEKYWFNCIEIINKHKRLDSLGLTSSTRIRLLSMIFGKDSKRTNITSIPLFRAYIGTLFTMKNFLRSIVSIALFVKYKLSIKSKSTSP